MPNSRLDWRWLTFALAILLSSFLIFQVQPLMGKYLLPWFGGTPGVWTACMLFFQVVLFAGYAYAHLLIRHCAPRTQCVIHFSLVIGAILLLPIAPDASWKPTGAEDPTWRILGLLAVSVGLPYFLLSSTGPLLQAWFFRTCPGSSAYRLYALSNLGSVVGLVSYPFLFEPLFAVDFQANLWSFGFKLFALACGSCAFLMRHSTVNVTAQSATPAAPDPVVSRGDRWLWFALPACASVMLLATTNQVCLDIAAIPFLWVLPLTLYLFSFILCFGDAIWYPRRTFAVGLAVSLACLCCLMVVGAKASLTSQVVVHFAALFFCCMVCHGELVRLKPGPSQLTAFYLAMSAGGAAGGVLVGLVAPFVFDRFVELHLGMFACCLLTLVVFFRDQTWVLHAGRPRWAWACLVVGLLGFARILRANAGETIEGELTVTRNFYGVLRVAEGHATDAAQHSRILVHGRVLHGRQFMTPARQTVPTCYYGEQSGIGQVLGRKAEHPRKVGLVGLGVGTLAVYGRPGDDYRFYEINPDVIRLANEYFTFLKHSQAHVETVLGDARLSLEREAPHAFDVLAIDAFSSDAIPAHLLTREAFEIYLRHLRPEGVLALHISNQHFDLEPVVRAAAEEFGLSATCHQSVANEHNGQTAAIWMLLSRAHYDETPRQTSPLPRVQIWTDRYNNLLEVLK